MSDRGPTGFQVELTDRDFSRQRSDCLTSPRPPPDFPLISALQFSAIQPNLGGELDLSPSPPDSARIAPQHQFDIRPTSVKPILAAQASRKNRLNF
ncbi:MAG: hypothetical protein KJ077_19530 [Anaerolineae bacterium]|nr:hypothetical protein [Anaerolineae bacterium]